MDRDGVEVHKRKFTLPADGASYMHSTASKLDSIF